MPKKAASPNMEFAVAQLRKNPKLSFAALKAAAQKKGLAVVPIVYGRAKLALGLTGGDLVSTVDGSSKRARARNGLNGVAGATTASSTSALAVQTPAPRRRGRPPRHLTAPGRTAGHGGGASNGGLNLTQLVEAVRLAEAQRHALEQIQAILNGLGIHGTAPILTTPTQRRRGRPRKTVQ